jgi:RNA polymerase sigma-70 factor (ECF subfamily)
MAYVASNCPEFLPSAAVVIPLASPAGRSARNTAEASALTARSEDDALLIRIANDDQTAFRMLVERHVDRAFALALRILRNAADADDVVQDCMLKLWTHRKRMEIGRAKFSTWLYRVVTNRCIDLTRAPRTSDIDEAPEVADERADVVDELHRSAVTTMLETALTRLPEQQRIALILSYHENMSNAEVAEVMDTTVMAVESLLKRGRTHLRKLLTKAEDDIRQSFTEK